MFFIVKKRVGLTHLSIHALGLWCRVVLVRHRRKKGLTPPSETIRYDENSINYALNKHNY